MWPIKGKENRRLLIMWPNFISYSKLQECVITVLLKTSTPLHFPTSLMVISCFQQKSGIKMRQSDSVSGETDPWNQLQLKWNLKCFYPDFGDFLGFLDVYLWFQIHLQLWQHLTENLEKVLEVFKSLKYLLTFRPF